MLSDAQIERWARQVVLPEVGGRGQERLLSSHVAVLGDDPTSRRAADLLRRAGVAVSEGGTDERADVVVDFRTDRASVAAAPEGPVVVAQTSGTRATLTVLPAARCSICRDDEPGEATVPGPLTACGLHALAALAASEALLVLLASAPRARRYTMDLATGELAATPLAPARCPHGAGSA
jgi:hypothetical protein